MKRFLAAVTAIVMVLSLVTVPIAAEDVGTGKVVPAPSVKTEPPAETQLNGYIADNSALAWGEFNETSPENVLLHDSSPMTYAAAYAGGTVYGFHFHYDLFEGTLDDRFFTMDPDTFEITYPEDAVGSNGAMVYAMAYNHAEGEMYALALDMMSGTVGVFTVDLALGMPRYKVALDAGFDAIGEPITITTLAIDGEGNAYGLSVSDTDSGLYSINLETGVCTLIGQTGIPLPYLQSTTWDHNTDRLFWAQYDDEDGRLYIIDPTDASVTLCGSIGSGYEVTGLWTANNEPVAPIVVSDYSVTFKDGLTDEEIEGGYVVAAGTVLDAEDFPEPPEHEDYEFAAWDYDGKPVYDDIVISAMYRDPNALGFYFEVNPAFEGWTWEDKDGDGFCWQWNLADPLNLYIVPEGEGCVSSFSFCNDTFEPLTPDNWLISPAVPGGGSVSFMLVAQDEGYPNENIGVYASTDGGITWSDELGYFTAAGEIQVCTVDLADFANMNIKLAFRHYDVTDQFCVNLDAVEIATGCEDAVLPEEITVEDMVVSVGETAETVYTIIPDDADDLRVTFAIADESIAAVDENGVVTGIAAGETEITVTSVGAPEVSGTAKITVIEPETPTEEPPTEEPPTEEPPTEEPPTEEPPTEEPPTEEPPTEEPPTEEPPTEIPTEPPTPPTTGFISLAGIGIAAILSGTGIVLFRRKRS